MTLRDTARRISLTLCPTLLLALAAAAPSAAQDAVGQVTSLVGAARASGPGGERALACGDPVYAGDTVTTEEASSAGILMGEVLARVDATSALAFGRTGEGAPDTTLERGRVRVIDAREEGAAARLRARATAVEIAGTDTEAYLLAEKIGPYAMFCEWDAPLAVSRGPESRTLDPHQCVIAKDAEPLYVADAHDERIPAEGGPPCPPELGHLAAPGPHFSPTDVAAGPPPDRWSSLARGVAGPGRDSCEDPGSGCLGGGNGGGGITIVSPPPGTGPQPGAPGPFGQN